MDLHDVEISDTDADRVDALVDSTSFTDTQAEAIVRFSRVDQSDRDPSLLRDYVNNGAAGDKSGVDADTCARIRTDMSRADRPTTVIDAYPDTHPSAIFRHATGRCDHDHDVDATTSPRIKPDECREMRVGFQTGDTVADLRIDYNRSKNAVVKHVFGRCTHDLHVDRRGRPLSPSACGRMRRAYRENPAASTADIGRAFLVASSTAFAHLTGECDHDTADPVDPSGVDEHDCGLIRRQYRTCPDVPIDDLSARFDISVSAFYYHLRGKCAHDPDADPFESGDKI